MMIQKYLKIYCLALALFSVGCAHAISEGLRQQVDPTISFTQVHEAPENYRDQMVMWGGTIAAMRNLENGTELEVAQRQLDTQGAPYYSDNSEGRFIFLHPGFLEPETFKKGRRVTGAGKVIGSKTGKIGDREYRFPLVEVEELRIWEIRQYRNYYSPYWGDPFYYPYYRPYYRPHYYPHSRSHRHKH